MSHDGHRLVRLYSQIEVAKDSLSTRRVSEPQILELNSAVGDALRSTLLWIDLRGFFNDAKYLSSRISSSRDRR